jgi:hypothetical protein
MASPPTACRPEWPDEEAYMTLALVVEVSIAARTNVP